MIQLAHVATGALAGRECAGVRDALITGIVTHAVFDVAPHGEVHDDAFEAVTAAASIIALAARHGIAAPITWGAIGGVLPDLEHVVPARFRSSRGWFVTHRLAWLHGWQTKPLAIPAWLQAIAGGAVVGALVSVARRQRRCSGTK